jgi:hypothetical protein
MLSKLISRLDDQNIKIQEILNKPNISLSNYQFILHLVTLCIALEKLKNPNNAIVLFLNCGFKFIPLFAFYSIVSKIHIMQFLLRKASSIDLNYNIWHFIIKGLQTTHGVNSIILKSLLQFQLNCIKLSMVSTIYYRIGRFFQITYRQLFIEENDDTVMQKLQNIFSITKQEIKDQFHEISRHIQHGLYIINELHFRNNSFRNYYLRTLNN